MTVGNPNTGEHPTHVNGHAHDTVVLLRPLGATTWLATAHGDEVTARPAPVTLAAAPSTPPADDHLVPFLGVARLDDTLGDTPWLLSGYVAGSDLDRLLSLATLTPAQAAAIAVEVYAGLAALHAAGVGHGHLGTRSVLVGVDGVVRLADWAAGSLAASRATDAPGRLQSADLEDARHVVTALARNADRPVVHKRARDRELLSVLERVAAREPALPAVEAMSALGAALHAATDVVGAHRDVDAELGALVTAARQRPAIAPLPAGLPAPASLPPRSREAAPAPAADEPARRSALPASLSAADWRRPTRHGRLWAIVAVVLVAAGAVLLARSPVSSLYDRLTHRQDAGGGAAAQAAGTKGAAARKPSAPARPAVRAVPVLAPAAAGIVTGVSLRPLGTCRAGRPCPVRVTVAVTPSDTVQQVRWAITQFDRCRGTRATRATGTLVAQPGWTSAYDSRTLLLPRVRALALVAHTTTPAQAASRAVLIPATARTC